MKLHVGVHLVTRSDRQIDVSHVSAKWDSEDMCIVGDRDYRNNLIEKYWPKKSQMVAKGLVAFFLSYRLSDGSAELAPLKSYTKASKKFDDLWKGTCRSGRYTKWMRDLFGTEDFFDPTRDTRGARIEDPSVQDGDTVDPKCRFCRIVGSK